jgi:hypothetical protein
MLRGVLTVVTVMSGPGVGETQLLFFCIRYLCPVGGREDGWMKGWMDGWMDGWIDGWVDEWKDDK